MYGYNELKFCPKCGNRLTKKYIVGRERLVCLACEYIIFHNSYPTVSAIIAENEKILFLKRAKNPKKGLWTLPAGFVEYEEDSEKAISREVFEETGLKVKIKGLIGVYLFKSNPESNTIGAAYKVDIVGGKLNIDKEESTNAKFFSVNKLPNNLAFPEQKKIIKDWRNGDRECS